MSDLSKIIKDFENFPYKGSMRKRPKHEPTDSYFYLSRKVAKCIMKYDAFNFHFDPIRTEITSTQHIPISHVFDSDERKSKGIVTDKNLS